MCWCSRFNKSNFTLFSSAHISSAFCRDLLVDLAYNDYGWYYTLDQMGSIFVGRMKSNARYDMIESRQIQSAQVLSCLVLSCEIIRLNSDKAKTDCPIFFRPIVFERAEDKRC